MILAIFREAVRLTLTAEMQIHVVQGINQHVVIEKVLFSLVS